MNSDPSSSEALVSRVNSFMYFTSPKFFHPVRLQHFFSIRVEHTLWSLIRRFRQKPADLDLQCFQKRINPGSAGQRLLKK